MSSFMLSEESIATIAGHMISMYDFNRAGGSFAMFSEDAKTAIIKACLAVPAVKLIQSYGSKVNESNLFFALYSLNGRALTERYGDDALKLPERAPSFYPNMSAIPLLKKVECFLYQCSEGNVPNDPLFKAVEELRDRLAGNIINNMPEYQAANWG